ncbi:VWA domain-containing protein [Candidatus Bathyarchaeota archaeon]|nr:VWA domain-containing protein [Candidatus Bathyarchaeota archaeon]
MKLYESAWFLAYDLTGIEQDSLKILIRDSTPFPFLTKDQVGFVLCLPNLKKVDEDVVEYQGMTLSLKDALHNQIIWSLFKASVYYLSLYTVVYDANAYKEVLKGKNEGVALNAINLIEDAIITAYIKTFYQSLLPEIIFSDTISYLFLKPAQFIRNEAVRLATSVLSRYKTGLVKGSLPEGMLKDTNNLVNMLRMLEAETAKVLAEQKIMSNSKNVKVKPTNNELKSKIFSEIYSNLIKYSIGASEVPSFLYMNHPTKTSILDIVIPSHDEVWVTFNEIVNRLDVRINLNMNALQNESVQNIMDWFSKERKTEKIIQKYQLLGEDTRLKDFKFPEEDYTEFLRRKIKHSKTIRRITNRLAMFYNVSGDDFRREAGFIDLQEAIQVIASKSRRSDIFMEDTLRYRAQCWAILVDVSLSLRQFAGEVKDIILCLTEVSRKLFSDNRSLGIFAFDDKFYIVKDFTENHGRTVSARIGGIQHSGMTYMPDAMKLTVRALRSQFEEEKILIVVSDGHPTGYEGIVDDTKEEVAEAIRKGLNVIGIGVDSSGIKEFFPTYCIVRTPYELMKKFADTFFTFS